MDNPLASRRAKANGPADPMLRHAQIWAHINQQSPEALAAHVTMMDYALPIMGALAANPNVTAKDVIKATTNAVADGKMEASKAVAAIANMPADPDKLRVWLKNAYATNLAATVHAKAALLGQGGQGQGQPAAAPGPAPGNPVPPQPAPPQGPMQ